MQGSSGATGPTVRVPDVIPDAIAEPREYSPLEILNIAHEARAMQGTQKEKLEQMRAKHREFWFRYPSLMEMCCTPNMDMQQLVFMLNTLAAVKKQDKSLDDADRDVYASLSQKFGVPSMAAATPRDAACGPNP